MLMNKVFAGFSLLCVPMLVIAEESNQGGAALVALPPECDCRVTQLAPHGDDKELSPTLWNCVCDPLKCVVAVPAASAGQVAVSCR